MRSPVKPQGQPAPTRHHHALDQHDHLSDRDRHIRAQQHRHDGYADDADQGAGRKAHLDRACRSVGHGNQAKGRCVWTQGYFQKQKEQPPAHQPRKNRDGEQELAVVTVEAELGDQVSTGGKQRPVGGIQKHQTDGAAGAHGVIHAGAAPAPYGNAKSDHEGKQAKDAGQPDQDVGLHFTVAATLLDPVHRRAELLAHVGRRFDDLERRRTKGGKLLADGVDVMPDRGQVAADTGRLIGCQRMCHRQGGSGNQQANRGGADPMPGGINGAASLDGFVHDQEFDPMYHQHNQRNTP